MVVDKPESSGQPEAPESPAALSPTVVQTPSETNDSSLPPGSPPCSPRNSLSPISEKDLPGTPPPANTPPSVDIPSSPRRESNSASTYQGTQTDSPRKASLSGSTDSPRSIHTGIVSTITTAWRKIDHDSCLIALGSLCAIAATLGSVNAMGLLQIHMEENQLWNFQPRDIGWVAAANVFLVTSVPAIAGPFFDRYGHKVLVMIATVLFVAGLLWMSFLEDGGKPPGGGGGGKPPPPDGKQKGLYAMMIITWGLLCGTGTGLVSVSIAGVVNDSFSKRRGVACGFVFVGNSLGGILWPILLRDTLKLWGWGWAIRAMAGVAAVLLILGNVLLRNVQKDLPGKGGRRMTENQQVVDDDEEEGGGKGREKSREGGKQKMFSFRCLKKSEFAFMAVSLAIFQFVVMGVTGTIPSWGQDRGFSRELVFNIIAAMNGGSAVGRVAIGALSDRIGRFNVVVLVKMYCAIVMFAVFLQVGKSTVCFYAFSVLWGFGSGATLNMISVLVGEVCDRKEFGMYYGTCSVVISIAAFLCVPLSAQMLVSFGTTLQVVFFGLLCVVSSALLTLARWAVLRYKWMWKVKV